jgi:uncharacterized protein (TIGR00297 family)
MLMRALAGLVLAVVVGLFATRARLLTVSGAIAATVVGTVAVAADWGWAAFLLIYFISSGLLSKLGASRKAARTAGMIEKGGARDAWQVLANGGVFAICLLISMISSLPVSVIASFAAICALSASAADTWATEIGTLVGHVPRSILTLRPMSVGESGGVTVAGWLGALAGAGIIAAAAEFFAPGGSDFEIVLIAGMIGTTVDSLAGATIQHRRRCETCGRMTEMPVHTCGTITKHVRGVSWIENDAVNLIATLAGAAVAVVVMGLLS